MEDCVRNYRFVTIYFDFFCEVIISGMKNGNEKREYKGKKKQWRERKKNRRRRKGGREREGETQDQISNQRRELTPMLPLPRDASESHMVKDSLPRISLNVGAVIFVEAFSWATLEAADPKGFLDSQVMLQLLRRLFAGIRA